MYSIKYYSLNYNHVVPISDPHASVKAMMGTLLYGQSSLTIQILLEMLYRLIKINSVPTRTNTSSSTTLPYQPPVSTITTHLPQGNIEEICTMTCSFIHELFINDPLLIKVVHFQTYPTELLPITTRGIPSMHICLDFLPELLSIPSPSPDSLGSPIPKHLLFAIELGSYLIGKFPIPKSLHVAEIILSHCASLPWDILVITSQQIQPQTQPISELGPADIPLSDSHFVMLQPCSPLVSVLLAVERICNALPVLLPKAITILHLVRGEILKVNGTSKVEERETSIKRDDPVLCVLGRLFDRHLSFVTGFNSTNDK